MSVAQEPRVATPEPGSDRAVVGAVRAGEIGQYALLYERYRDEALRIARRQVGPDEAQDLVQETFARVLRAIQNGGGPTQDVAGYIFRTLRNLRIDRGGQREFATEDMEKAGPAGLWVVPDTTEEVLDRGLVADAFAELPPRWREVLWLTEVEGVGPSELSDRMGIKPTAVSTLSLRARAGFRSAWLQAHVRAGSAPTECRSVVTRLGDYQTGRLSSRRREQVKEHLDHCDHCPAVMAELTAASERLGALLLPVVILAPKALWWLFGGWSAKLGLLLWGTKTTLNRLRDPKVAVSSVGGAATIAVATAVAMAMMSAPEPPPAADPAPAASAPATATPRAQASPTAGDDEDADSPERGAPADDAPADSPVSVPPPAASDPGDAPAPEPTGPVADAEPTGPVAGPEPTDAGPTTSEPTDPEPTDPEPAGPSVPEQLVLDEGQQLSGPLDAELVLTGTGAVPGATIIAADGDGDVVAESDVGDDGSWTVQIQRPEVGAEGSTDENQRESAGESAAPAGAGAAARGIAARSLVDAVAERDQEQARDEDDDPGSGDDGDNESGDGEDEEYHYTLVQHVAEGISEEYAGTSEPLRLGPYTWVTVDEPEPEPEPEPVGSPMILSPTEGEVVRLSRGTRSFDVRFCRDQALVVQFSLNGDPIGTVQAGPSTGCEGGSGEPATVRWAPAGPIELTLQYLDEQGEPAGEPMTVRFTACLEAGCDAGDDATDAPGNEDESSGDQSDTSGEETENLGDAGQERGGAGSPSDDEVLSTTGS